MTHFTFPFKSTSVFEHFRLRDAELKRLAAKLYGCLSGWFLSLSSE
jgi:hypothetical protein